MDDLQESRRNEQSLNVIKMERGSPNSNDLKTFWVEGQTGEQNTQTHSITNTFIYIIYVIYIYIYIYYNNRQSLKDYKQ